MTVKSKSKEIETALIPLLVTTSSRGVFYGWGNKEDVNKTEIRIQRARMCVYWSSDIRGVFGLASVGPSRTCKIGFEVPATTLQGVISITECSPEAVAKWEAQPWA
jgi:hypothetical protein